MHERAESSAEQLLSLSSIYEEEALRLMNERPFTTDVIDYSGQARSNFAEAHDNLKQLAMTPNGAVRAGITRFAQLAEGACYPGFDPDWLLAFRLTTSATLSGKNARLPSSVRPAAPTAVGDFTLAALVSALQAGSDAGAALSDDPDDLYAGMTMAERLAPETEGFDHLLQMLRRTRSSEGADLLRKQMKTDLEKAVRAFERSKAAHSLHHLSHLYFAACTELIRWTKSAAG